DKVDTKFLARAIDRFDGLLAGLDGEAVSDYVGRDPNVWDADLSTSTGSDGTITANAAVYGRDGGGTRAAGRSGKTATFALFCDDFFAAADKAVVTDDGGQASVSWSPDEIAAIKSGGCTGRRWVHLTSGDPTKDGGRFLVLEKMRAVSAK